MGKRNAKERWKKAKVELERRIEKNVALVVCKCVECGPFVLKHFVLFLARKSFRLLI